MKIRIVTKLAREWQCCLCPATLPKHSQGKIFEVCVNNRKRAKAACIGHSDDEINTFVRRKRGQPDFDQAHKHPRKSLLDASIEELRDMISLHG